MIANLFVWDIYKDASGTIIMACPLFISGQNEYLRINNVNSAWNNQPGSIDSVVFEVKPKGIYTEIGMYFDFSTRGTSFSHYDSLEIEILFQLPHDAEVIDMWLWIEDTIIVADILDKWTASQIYEDIVDRRTDPAILYKYEFSWWDYYGQYNSLDNYYMFRIFPLLTSLPRKAKITYLIKNTDALSSHPTIALPVNILKLSNNNILSAKVNFFPEANRVSPVILENSSTTFNQCTHPQLGTYYEANITSINPYFSTITLSCSKNDQEYISIGTYHDSNHNEDLFQLQLIPDELFGLSRNKKALFLFDFIPANCSALSSSQLLNQLKLKILNQFSNSDSVNFMFSGYVNQLYNSTWIPADSASITNAFNTISTSWFNSFSNLPALLQNGIQFIKSQNENSSIILISSSGSHGAYQQANTIIANLIDQIDTMSTPIHIIDLNTQHSPSYNIGGQYFYGNEYLYLNLSMQTVGEYLTINENQFSDMLTNLFTRLSGYFSNFDLYVTLENGYTYSTFNLFAQSGLIYFDQPVQCIGKFLGTGRFRIIAHGLLPSGQIFSADLFVNNGNVFIADSITRSMWAAQMLRGLASMSQTNTIKSQIIYTSISERVLSDYTAFLTLEPGLGPLSEGNSNPSVIETEQTENKYLFTVYPNPFRDKTIISFQLNDAAHILIEIYDIYGRKVSVVNNSKMDKGDYELSFEAGNLQPGTYFCRMVVNNKDIKVLKMVIIR